MNKPQCVLDYDELKESYSQKKKLAVPKMPPDVLEFYKILNYKKRLRNISNCADRKSAEYDLEAITEELAFHLHQTHSQQGRNIIFMMKYQPKFLTDVGEQVSQCSFQADQLTPYKLNRLLTFGRKVNLYCTNCTFQSNYRRQSHLAYSAECLALDIDYYNIPRLKNKSAEEVYKKICDKVFRPRGLEPTYGVDSGNGLYVFFILAEPLMLYKKQQNVDTYKKLMTALLGLTKDFGSDYSCCDLSRILRIPGSINFKTGRMVKIIDFDTIKEAPLKRYRIEELTKLLKIEPSKAAIRPAPKWKPNSNPTNLNELTSKTLGQARADDLIQWLENRAYDIKGFRGNFFFILALSLSEFKDSDSVLQDIKDINYKLKEPVPLSRLMGTLRSCEPSPNPKRTDKIDRYTYKNSKIIDLLKITPAEIHNFKTIITKDEVRQREYRRRKQQCRNAEGLTSRQAAKADKLIQIQAYLEQGQTKAEIARLMGISKALVSTYTKS